MQVMSMQSECDGNRRLRHRMARVIRRSFLRLGELEAHARKLRERMPEGDGDSPFGRSLDLALQELGRMRLNLSAWASAIGLPGAIRESAHARADTRPKSAAWNPAKLAALFSAECESCGRRLCSLLQAARECNDTAIERMAGGLLYTLEKLLWILRPHAETPLP